MTNLLLDDCQAELTKLPKALQVLAKKLISQYAESTLAAARILMLMRDMQLVRRLQDSIEDAERPAQVLMTILKVEKRFDQTLERLGIDQNGAIPGDEKDINEIRTACAQEATP